ncbi:glycoside hydrolase superfamily [Aspergillus pseudoustus]|uniref:alpha-galactosidase n=1 Tax=Aspergillus pseudoustus TaxID=1810923 RepID=A0ABR4JXG0_9EURO
MASILIKAILAGGAITACLPATLAAPWRDGHHHGYPGHWTGTDITETETTHKPTASPTTITTTPTSSSSSPTLSSSAPAGIWQPALGSKWDIVLSTALSDTSSAAPIIDIDLFDNSASTISALQSAGSKVICYFSAGTYEDWRSDAAEFADSDLGDALEDWEGERWVDLRSTSLRSIMSSRLDLAVTKGCNGVDPDNVDAFDNSQGGLGLTEDDSIEFMNWLAGEAHSRGLAIGLKNALSIIDGVIDNMEWAVNEQCAEYGECDLYAPFVEQAKPIFHIEYPNGEENSESVSSSEKKSACEGYQDSDLVSTILKKMNLDTWVQEC